MRAAVLVLSLLVLLPWRFAGAKVLRVDLSRVVAMAAERAPQVLRARSELLVARSHGVLDRAGAMLTPRMFLQAGPCLASGLSLCGQVALRVPLPLPGERDATRRLGDLRTTAGSLNARAARWSARLTAQIAYLGAVAAREGVHLADLGERVAARILAATEVRMRAGDLAKLDRAQVATRLLRRRRQKAAALRRQQSALDHLRRLLFLDPRETLVTTESLDALTASALRRASSPRPLTRHPLIKEVAARARVHAAGARLATIRSRWPRLAFIGSYQRDTDAHIFTVGLMIPFAPLSSVIDARTALAAARARRTRQFAEVLTRELTLVREAARARMRRSQEILLLARRQMAQAKRLLQLVVRGYRLGQYDLVRVLTAEAALLAARRDVIEATEKLAHAALVVEAGGAP